MDGSQSQHCSFSGPFICGQGVVKFSAGEAVARLVTHQAFAIVCVVQQLFFLSGFNSPAVLLLGGIPLTSVISPPTIGIFQKQQVVVPQIVVTTIGVHVDSKIS